MNDIEKLGSALGWASHITKRIRSITVYFEDGKLVIQAKTLSDCNNISKKIHTDPCSKSSSFLDLPIVIKTENRVWDEFNLAEIQSVLAFRGERCQSQLLLSKRTVKVAKK